MKIILIVGPSGAGKDSLLRECSRNLSYCGNIVFVPRYLTRMVKTFVAGRKIFATC